MLPAEDIAAVNAIVRGPHRVLTRVKIADATSWHLLGEAAWEDPLFEIIDGSVSESREDVGRSLTMNVVSDYWESPFDAIKELSPYKVLVSVERGVRTPTKDIYVPLGVFRIYDLSVQNSSGGSVGIGIQGYSEEASVRDARFFDRLPKTGPPPGFGNTIKEIVQGMLNDTFSSPPSFVTRIGSELDYRFDDGKELTEPTNRDRLALINLLEKDRGVWGRFNRKNEYEIVIEPSVDDKTIWKVDAGPEGVLVSVGKNFTREGIFNGISATANDQDNKWTHTVYKTDDDPASPTRWGGPFGKVPLFWSSPLFSVAHIADPAWVDPGDGSTAPQIPVKASEDKAIATLTKAATTRLTNSTVIKAGVDFESVPNPILEVGDTIEIVFKPGGDPKITGRVFHARMNDVEVKETHLIETLEIGLGADTTMTGTTSAKAVTLAELGEM